MRNEGALHFALSALVLWAVRDVTGSGLSCLRSGPSEGGQTRVTFLREDSAGVRSLYLTRWSEDLRLVTCEVNTSPAVVESYVSECDGLDTQSPEIPQRFMNLSMQLDPDDPCALSSSAPKFARRTRRDGGQGTRRSKRSWIFPGTLWCGSGSRAGGYEQLGMFEGADRCCREHDHCLHVIPALTVHYGVFNPNFFTVSHCDCDQRFRDCLLGVNDTISRMVGYSFFNILQIPCFELTQLKRCTEMYWWGMCKAAGEAPYAVFRRPLSYNTSHVSGKHEDATSINKSDSSDTQPVTQSPVTSKHRTSPRGDHGCRSRGRARGDSFSRPRMKGIGCKRRQKSSSEAQMLLISQPDTTTPSLKMALTNVSETSTLISNKIRVGKRKGTRKGLSTDPTQRIQESSQVTHRRTTSTTQPAPAATQRPAPQWLSSTDIQTVSSGGTTQKPSRCCGSGTLVRGDTFQHPCASCQEQTAIVKPSATIDRLLVNVTPARTQTTLPPSQHSLTRPWTTAAPAKATTFKDGRQQEKKDSRLLWNEVNQELLQENRLQSPHWERGSRENKTLHNLADSRLLCRSLKHLDECRYKISPLKRKYELQNTENKTAYHCDCTSRLAGQIEIFKQPGILSSLLMDFMAQYCFTLPKEKCYGRKSCSGGFTKPFDLLQALQKKDTSGERNPGTARKRGIPVRLYKRCLRLKREADITAQLI